MNERYAIICKTAFMICACLVVEVHLASVTKIGQLNLCDGPCTEFAIFMSPRFKKIVIKIYRVQRHKDNPIPAPSDIKQLHVTPSSLEVPLQELERNPEIFDGIFLRLIEASKKAIPKDYHSRTPVFFISTSTMEDIYGYSMAKILSRVTKFMNNLKNHPFLPPSKHSIKRIVGSAEMMFRWITANFLAGNLSEKRLQKATNFGLINLNLNLMTQIAFPLFYADKNVTQSVSVGGESFLLASGSYTRKGISKGLRFYIQELAKGLPMQIKPLKYSDNGPALDNWLETDIPASDDSDCSAYNTIRKALEKDNDHPYKANNHPNMASGKEHSHKSRYPQKSSHGHIVRHPYKAKSHHYTRKHSKTMNRHHPIPAIHPKAIHDKASYPNKKIHPNKEILPNKAIHPKKAIHPNKANQLNKESHTNIARRRHEINHPKKVIHSPNMASHQQMKKPHPNPVHHPNAVKHPKIANPPERVIQYPNMASREPNMAQNSNGTGYTMELPPNNTINGISSPCSPIGTSLQVDDAGYQYSLLGIGDVEKCRGVIQKVILNKYTRYTKNPFMIRPRRAVEFYAAREVVLNLKALGCTDCQESFNVEKIDAAARKYCSGTKGEQFNAVPNTIGCLNVNFIYVMLTQAYHFNRQTPIHILNSSVRHIEDDWALGAMLYKMNLLVGDFALQ